jgi:hypothetical protein
MISVLVFLSIDFRSKILGYFIRAPAKLALEATYFGEAAALPSHRILFQNTNLSKNLQSQPPISIGKVSIS